MAFGLNAQHAGSQFPNQELKAYLLQWKCRVPVNHWTTWEVLRQYCTIIIKLPKRLDLNYFSHWKEMTIMWLDGDANYTTMAIISLHVNVLIQPTCCTPSVYTMLYIKYFFNQKNLKHLLIIIVLYFEELTLSL